MVRTRMHTSPTATVVVYQGVLVDEAEVFRFVLSRIPDLQTVTVGNVRGEVAGPGGVVVADSTLDEIGNPEVVAVPGGIGSDHCTDIADWLRTVSPAWILASSTGSVILAAAGLLRHHTAATHWLAGPLLERYGAHASREKVVVDGRIITCSGSASAFRAALVIAEAYGGQLLVDEIRAEVAAGKKPEPTPRYALWRRLWNRLRGSRHELKDAIPSKSVLDEEPDVIDLGLVTLHPPADRTDEPR
jgi:transcriptional regulator GlxA family with amidase domain